MDIDTGSSMQISPSKSRDLADENKKKIDGMEMIRNNRITNYGFHELFLKYIITR